MVQLSRPFQAVLAAVALFALVWFVALHRPGSSPTDSGSSSGSSAQSGGTRAASPATTRPAGAAHSTSGAHGTSVSHSTAASHTSKSPHAAASAHVKDTAPHAAGHARTAPHTGGHTRATAHAGAAAHSGETAARTQHTASGAHSTAHTGAAVRHKAPSTAHKAPPTGHAGTSREAATVAADLEHGKTVMLLFWNPRASNDVTVHQQVGVVAHKLGRSVAAFSAHASQVGQFGSITRDVQVYQTPTLLIVNPKRQVTTVTGLTDAYALEQTIREARG